MKSGATGFGATLLLVCFWGCSSESSSSSSTTSVRGRGSEVCNHWQSAICAYSAKCGGLQRAECDEQAKAVTCSSDQLAGDCEQALRPGDCSNPPLGCDLRDLADPAPAVAACEQYMNTVCAADERCGGPPVADCVAGLQTRFNCSASLGYKLSFEPCIRALETHECGAAAPTICNGVFLQ